MVKTRRKIGPYSRVVQRGAIADLVDGRSREGRIMRHMEAELIKHIGGKPNFMQRLLIERIVKIRMQLDIFEEKLARGEAWTPDDGRTYGALHNAIRRTAREIGLTAVPTRTPPVSMPRTSHRQLSRVGPAGPLQTALDEHLELLHQRFGSSR